MGSRLTLDPDFAEVTDVLERILQDFAPEPPTEVAYQSGSDGLWARLAKDGWLELGIDSAPSLRELVQVGELWGHHLPALPFLETVLVRRWLENAGEAPDGPATIALPGRWTAVVIPFADLAPTVVAGAGDGVTAMQFTELEALRGDDTAPSLPLTEAQGCEPLPDHLAHEVYAIYAGVAVGASGAALAQSIEHARQREAYGQPIGRFQAMQHRMANMHRDLEIARTAALWASQDVEAAGRAARAALDRARSVLEGAMQVFGGMSYTWELGLHYYLRHILALRQVIDG